jgi:steroid delta-isomerase-like uncharacterized protein
MSIESTRKVLEAYWNSDPGDNSMMADDVVFTDMANGVEHQTPEGVRAMLNWFYQVAFEATFEKTNLVIADGHGVLEGIIAGKHIGEFAGIPATNKDFRAPTCISYDVEDGKLKRGRVYFSVASFMAQVGALGGQVV